MNQGSMCESSATRDTGMPVALTGAGTNAARFAELAQAIEERKPVFAPPPPPAPADRIKKPLSML